MDLRSIINNEAADSSAPKQVTPTTPVIGGPPQQSFREYNHGQKSSSSKHPSQDYGSRSSEAYASPTSYQPGYQGRPAAPPPLQPPSQNDLRSPTASYSAQSPYPRNTPTSSIGGGQYPFPPNQIPQSPAQNHPYANPHQRDSYPPPHQPQQHLPQQNHYGQQSPINNTPPAGAGGSGHPYFQQHRSQSSLSNSTPTSAHQQQQYHQQYTPDSPVSVGSFSHTALPQHQRHQSQPQTPLGPPASNPGQGSGGFPLPTSPYQQRPPSSGGINHPYPSSHSSTPPSVQYQNSRPPTTPSVHTSRQTSIAESLPRTQSVREQSMSVSPKTQPPSLPRADSAASQGQYIDNGRSATPKRKMDDREVSAPAITPQIPNGVLPKQPTITPSPQQPARKRVRYTEPPIWAQSFTKRVKNNGGPQSKNRPVNGILVDRAGQPQQVNGNPQASTLSSRPIHQSTQDDLRGNGPLGAWEPSIIGTRPYEEVSKLVADWLFLNVVSRPDAGELAGRGVEIEIEAKLGQLINKDTNERFFLPVQSECILAENGRVGFHSTMTEAQHKSFNDFLNAKVEETHPENPNRAKTRVQVVYAHRRERDRFYELPQSLHNTLPACIRNVLNPRHAIKVRVTHDQKTGQLLAKIIKARVADLDLYIPRCPLDCRISVNLEMRYDGDVDSLIQSADSSRMPDRNKDRLSYTQSHYQIDLTQVTIADPGSRGKEHELEIELSSAAVREQGRRAAAGEDHWYSELIEGFMDNVRVLARNAPKDSAILG